MQLIPATDENLEKYKSEIESGKMKIEFRLFSGNSFVTEFGILDARTVLEAYSDLPDISIESYIHDCRNPEICDKGRRKDDPLD